MTGEITFVYSDQENPDANRNRSIFLGGPSPRGDKDPAINWRLDAVELIKKLYEGEDPLTVYIPLPSTGVVDDYDTQVEWEDKYLDVCDVALFWIPRDLERLPGFTTNFEFGEYLRSGKIVYGRPDESPKNRYIDKKFVMYNTRTFISNTLEDTVKEALSKV